MFDILETVDKTVLEIEIDGEITKDDYDRLDQAIIEKLKETEKVKLFCWIKDLSGITAEAIISDFKLLVKHYTNIEKMAIVSTEDWIEWVTKLEAVLPMEVKYFDNDEKDLAWKWLMKS